MLLLLFIFILVSLLFGICLVVARRLFLIVRWVVGTKLVRSTKFVAEPFKNEKIWCYLKP